MKSTISSTLLLMAIAVGSFAQSDSFLTLKNKFEDRDNVHVLATSGFLARTLLWMAGEHEFNQAVKEIRHIRLITVPKEAFAEQRVTLQGFKKIVKKDNFEELAHIQDHGDDVTLYMQPATKGWANRYLLLIDGSSEIVAIEVKGYIDPDMMLKGSQLSCKE